MNNKLYSLIKHIHLEELHPKLLKIMIKQSFRVIKKNGKHIETQIKDINGIYKIILMIISNKRKLDNIKKYVEITYK